MFRGYVGGVQDSFNGIAFCVPADVPLSQASAVVRKYLADNPQLWNEQANVLVVRALKQAYPCQK
ncbi:Rap1a/Tai family immunity protein [Rhodanobacter sp. Col0626]|uniref:Rap1a/Tai family immunity protein n=1 Tax=Rhodanobacter sp. Col0626 TaxID=3415679 RepID=UPI003CF1867F